MSTFYDDYDEDDNLPKAERRSIYKRLRPQDIEKRRRERQQREADAIGVSVQDGAPKSQRKLAALIRRYAAWDALRPRLGGLSIVTMSIVISVMSSIVFFMALLFFLVPWLPSGWPSFGVVFLLPSFIRFILGLVAEGTVSLALINLLKGVSIGYALLDTYSLICIATWIVEYYLNTLSPAAAAHASATSYWFLLIPALFMFVLDVVIFAMHQTISSAVPRELAIRGRMDGLSEDEIEKEVAKL